MRARSKLRDAVAVVALAQVVWVSGGPQMASPSQGPAVDAAVLRRLASLPRAAPHSEVRVDYDATRNQTRVWLNTNEDDGRLYTRAGGQMDAEFRVSSLAAGRPGTGLPAEVLVEFATLGEMRPAGLPHALDLVADGRVVSLTQTAEPEARSGNLLFLSVKTAMPVEEFFRLVTSTRVEGRIWGHSFVLIDTQLEMLREYASRLLSG